MSLEVKDFELGEDLMIHVHCLDRKPGGLEVGESELIKVPVFNGFAKLSDKDNKTFLQNYINGME